MKRLEIIANRAVEEDLFDLLNKYQVGNHYTKIPIAHGVGKHGPRRGDHIWPEENFILIIYCPEEEAVVIRKAVEEVKSFFKNEGIKLFEL